MAKYTLRLYIAGRSLLAEQAIANLESLVAIPDVSAQYESEVIDIFEHPSVAEEEHILATPVLVKAEPKPYRRIVGDLSDIRRVLIGLDILPSSRASQ